MKIVVTTAPEGVAERISETLVDERLAACASRLGGVRSVFRWKGAIDRADEVLIVLKTSEDKADALVVRIRELHPYEVPEILVMDPSWVLPAYAQWLRESTGGHAPQKKRASAADERVGTGASPAPGRTMPRRGRTPMAAKKAKKAVKKVAKKAGKKKK